MGTQYEWLFRIAILISFSSTIGICIFFSIFKPSMETISERSRIFICCFMCGQILIYLSILYVMGYPFTPG